MRNDENIQKIPKRIFATLEKVSSKRICIFKKNNVSLQTNLLETLKIFYSFRPNVCY